MAKLRLFKERRPQAQGETPASDLRGLDDPELLAAGGFEARLDLRGEISKEQIQSLCEAYQLEQVPGVKGHSLRKSKRTSGSHKLDTLALLFAALEIVRANSSAHGRIHWVSKLHQNLASRSSRQFLNVHEKSVARLALHAPVSATLAQAGFAVECHEGQDTLLNHGGIDMLHDSVNSSAVATLARKAA
jgi:hypothetical protein